MALVVFSKGFLKHQKVIESKYIESVNLQKKPEAIQEWNMVQANLRCLVDSCSPPIFRTVDDGCFIRIHDDQTKRTSGCSCTWIV